MSREACEVCQHCVRPGVFLMCSNGRSEFYEGWVSRLGYCPEFKPTEEACPGHVASAGDPKVCGRCGVHIDSFRPDDDDGAAPTTKQRERAF